MDGGKAILVHRGQATATPRVGELLSLTSLLLSWGDGIWWGSQASDSHRGITHPQRVIPGQAENMEFRSV